MTPEQRKAVERLTAMEKKAHAVRYHKELADLRTLLALVREPVASVTGRVVSVTHDRRIIEVHCDRDAVPWTAGLLGKYVDVHAVDAGEEK